MICNRCLLNKPDSDFPLGEKICRKCKNEYSKARRLKKKQIEDEAKRQMDLVFKQGRQHG
jgi:hypothetical protein